MAASRAGARARGAGAAGRPYTRRQVVARPLGKTPALPSAEAEHRGREPQEAMREAHVPAQQSKAQQDPRLPPPDADPRGPGGAQGPTDAGPQAARGLTQPIRDRGTFEALARAPAVRRGALSVRTVGGGSPEPTRVA